MKTKQFKTAIALSVFITIAIVSCKKETSTSTTAPAGKQSVAVYLNDDPVPNLLKVLVDIRYVEVKIDTGKVQHDDDYYNGDNDSDDDQQHYDQYGRWDTLSITPRVYDLLKLKNGVDTLIANAYANSGKITKVRITLGSNNTVWTDSTHSYPLPLCDDNPYLYVKIKSNSIETLPGGQVRIRIDFDVAKSIEFENGVYCLKPKLKSYSDNTTGKIEGVVKPGDAHPLLKVYNATDTAYAIPEEDGEYKIRGLKPAIYSVLFKATAPYRDSTIANVQVTTGQTTTIPSIMLHQ
ncbi:MAG: DUF4382 domain-containing protein [Sphingobacteriales bacterium]|nr:DUF4382 domain-containing protein [Sphingobacteriales bacterium]MBI3720469.1 DUF4382 domain-containing protein [Sphingobacteriales bacterium]